MPLHPQAAAFLEEQRRTARAPDHEVTVEEARRRADVRPARVEEVGSVTDTAVPGPGGPLPVRVYTPTAAPAGVVLYLHGGGHVTGTVDSYDGLMRRLANRVPAVVVAVDYRRAPEHRCPAPVDDAEAVYRSIRERRTDLGVGSGDRLVLAGDSAGGNYTAVLARRLRDTGGEQPALQVLIYPTLDAVAYRGGTDYPSYTECGNGYGLTYADGLWYWDHYLGPDGNCSSPDTSPLRAASLAGLAPTYLLTVEYDVLRDEGYAYADRLRDAFVEVEHRHWPGHLHGFVGDPDTYDDAEPALNEIASAIQRALVGSRLVG